MSKNIIGVDIGGTKISSGLFNDHNELVDSLTLPAMADKPKDTVINQVVKGIQILLDKAEITNDSIKGIGICSPGPINPVSGDLLNPPNLPSLWNINLIKELETFFPVKIKIENDANAAALAESRFGAAIDYNNVFYVTVSTGIGTGIIINKSIYHGKNGLAGEGGHLSCNYKGGVSCNCLIPGCLESIASGTAIAKKARELIELGKAENSTLNKYKNIKNSPTTKDIAEMALNGDKLALQLIEDSAFHVGAWLGGMINLLDPDIIVIGGGVASLGKLYFDTVRKTALKYTYNPFADQTPIVAANLQKDAGIYGAASLFIE